jgi:hypothetical protein
MAFLLTSENFPSVIFFSPYYLEVILLFIQNLLRNCPYASNIHHLWEKHCVSPTNCLTMTYAEFLSKNTKRDRFIHTRV